MRTKVFPETGETPLWNTFLAETCKRDKELVAYTRRLHGYFATGLVSERKAYVLDGHGRNVSAVLTPSSNFLARERCSARSSSRSARATRSRLKGKRLRRREPLSPRPAGGEGLRPSARHVRHPRPGAGRFCNDADEGLSRGGRDAAMEQVPRRDMQARQRARSLHAPIARLFRDGPRFRAQGLRARWSWKERKRCFDPIFKFPCARAIIWCDLEIGLCVCSSYSFEPEAGVRRLEVITGTGRRRRWSVDDEGSDHCGDVGAGRGDV